MRAPKRRNERPDDTTRNTNQRMTSTAPNGRKDKEHLSAYAYFKEGERLPVRIDENAKATRVVAMIASGRSSPTMVAIEFARM